MIRIKFPYQSSRTKMKNAILHLYLSMVASVFDLY